MSRPIVHRIAFVMAGALLLASCTSAGDGETAEGSGDTAPEESVVVGDPTTETADGDIVIAFQEPDADDFNRLLTSESDLGALQVAAILDIETTAPDQLLVTFEMESHHCFGPRAGAAETGSEIIIEVLTGQRPGIDPATCTYGIYPYTTVIDLAAPVGSRTIALAEPREPAQPESPEEQQQTGSGDTPTMSPTIEPTDMEAGRTPQLVREFVEDGVEWAIENGVEWRVLSFDGVPAATDAAPTDPDRISFVVVKDHIVAYEWS